MKSRMSGFSRRALQEAHTTLFGMWRAGYWSVSDFGLVLKVWLGVLAEFLGSFYADHVRFDLYHPYIERLPTLFIICIRWSVGRCTSLVARPFLRKLRACVNCMHKRKEGSVRNYTLTRAKTGM